MANVFTIQTNNLDFVLAGNSNPYPYTLTAYMDEYPEIEEVASSTITFVNPCPDLSCPASLPLQEYTITDDPYTFTIPELDSSACPLAFTYSIRGPAAPAITNFDSDTLQFTVQYTSDLTLTDVIGPEYYKDYEVELIGVDPDGTEWLNCDFTLRLKNPCVDSEFVRIEQPSTLLPSPFPVLTPITYTLFDHAEDYSHSVF